MYDLGEDKGSYYITMEYVPGEDLKSFLRRSKRLTVETTVSIGIQICEGLAEAHRLGVVHRDLKPGNIMIDKDGNARIMDFGIARSLKGKGITRAGAIIGTPDYISPEQVDGKDVDQRADIYSLGVIFYEMVTGQVPFEGDTPLSIAYKHKHEAPQDPRKINAQIPDDLNHLILKCLEKDKENRYQSSGELRAELENIEKGIPTTAREIPAKTPLTSKEITVQFRIKNIFIPAFIVFAIVITVIVIWQFLPKREAAPIIPSDKPSLAVMYFENNTGEEDLDHWRKSISDLLITDLSQSKYLRVTSMSKLLNILKEAGLQDEKSYSSEDLTKVAAGGAVGHILTGSYTKAGDTFRINVSLQEAHTGEHIDSLSTEGKGEESIFPMVDELTIWTKTSLKLSAEQVTSDLDMEIGDVTTKSPEAYQFYIEGRKLHNKGEWQQSIEFMKKAIALDPGFAMAYRSMAVAFGQLGRHDERENYMQKALELSDRLTESEKLLIQGGFYSRESAHDKAIEAYEKLLTLNPENTVANNNLGLLYAGIEEWDKSIECFEAAIKAETSFHGAYTNLAIPYMAKGEYDKAKKALEDSISRFPDDVGGHWGLAILYAFQGQFDLALNEVDKAAAINPTYTKARFYHMKGDFTKAEEGYKKWFDHVSQSTHLLASTQLESLYLTQGRFEEAISQILQGIDLAEKLGSSNRDRYRKLAYHYLRSGKIEALEAFEKAWTLGEKDPQTRHKIYDLGLKGWIYIEMGKLDEAQNAAEEIKELVATSLFKKEIRNYHFLMGMIKLKKESYSDAVEYFKNAVSLLHHPNSWASDHAVYMYYLALAYYKSGDLEKARDVFEGIVEFTFVSTSYGDLYAQSFYMLGKIYEQQGNTAKAIEHYERFLDLWKGADPGIAEVEDARERVAGLKDNKP
jgi:tetratricopeptide (TPR) repeat protein/TolB-like protein